MRVNDFKDQCNHCKYKHCITVNGIPQCLHCRCYIKSTDEYGNTQLVCACACSSGEKEKKCYYYRSDLYLTRRKR